MSDTSLADGLIESAKKLVRVDSRTRPRQSDLRRSISSAYYAVFHALAKTCADSLVGKTKSRRPNKAWVEVYRGLDHGVAKTACEAATNVEFPIGIKDFADAFMQLQSARHASDYDPMIRVSKTEAVGFIALAEDSIKALREVGSNDKLAFSAWVLIASRGAKEARRRVQGGNIRQI